MPRSLDYRATSAHPAEKVYAAMVDRDLLEQQLKHLGGPGAAVTAYETEPGGVRYTLRHGIAAADLPSVVTSFIPGGDLKINRTEHWRAGGAGHYDGTGSVEVVGTPATARSVMRIVDVDGGSEVMIRAEVTVRVPLLGSRIEEAVAGQIEKLLAAETEFTLGQIS
ncbi:MULTISPECIES: DUF2505 domain-containing protein [Pseudonocardia]|uniref:DUF2505 domain-containing protein n=2 Tax=Pseudonocardia TaxID=1847 RepID=A0A1Y2MS98_PSEAH|nr:MULTISPECIES: DUF2505 domain-containing protein [Pseudonocardia]OSY38095.1 hypothetical protein BG845_04268 [Pseudonocardia autotrophica]TDN75536.1 uncharacterized protein DUF2505 [Pseudonocardia autotrophica]BBF99506.1 hypothetical protein Pdca_07160 [Pseudonocardia autotrophica]GEC28507.1 hypothetical protein PSA01_55360 [Pseudonocardia saturnea]